MTYKLAKKLKDAGFPQVYTNKGGRWVFDFSVNRPFGEDCYAPSLSELIEACLEDRSYFNLELHGSRWHAMTIECSGYGLTSEEAVAHLWIALRKELSN